MYKVVDVMFIVAWSYIKPVWDWIHLLDISTSVIVLAVTSILGALCIWLCSRKHKGKDRTWVDAKLSGIGEESVQRSPSGRIRKRDIVRYYGKRMIRKAGMELGHLRRRPKERVINIARKFSNYIQREQKKPETQLYREPPEAFLEADYLEGDTNVPAEVLYLLKSVRAFGHFEKPLFMELCKHVETKFVPAGAILFRPGQKDDSIYVVKNGRLKVHIIEPDGTELPLKEVGPGESIHSMLSILDVVTGHPKPFKTVAARATRDTYVLMVNGKAFQSFFAENPDSLLRMVQIIMLRLQRVTFLALNQFLGIGRELLNQKPPSHIEDYSVSKLKSHPVMFSSSVLSRSPDSFRDIEYNSLSRSQDSRHDSDSDTGLDSMAPSSHVRKSSEKAGKRTHKSISAKSGMHPPPKSGGGGKSSAGGGPSKSTDSEPLSDDSSSVSRTQTLRSKSVAIDTTQNKHFTHRLLPVQSPEFDNVIDQARVDRRKFSSESVKKSSFVPLPQSSLVTVSGHSSTGSCDHNSVSCDPVFSHFASIESEDVLRAATEDLIKIFQLEDDSLLKSRIQLIEVPSGSVLGLEGDTESCVYFIASGKLKVFRLTGEDNTTGQDLLYVACPGEFCGVLSALTGEPSFISIMASVDSHLIAITKTNFYHIMSEQPVAVCGIAFDLVERMSPFVRQIDFGLDWMELEAGRALYRQGDEANSAYIILNGRVRSVVRKSNGKKELVDEFGRGETIGLVEVMTNSTCATTVHAIRDTELACLPVGLLNTIKLKQPQVVSRLIQVLGEKILGSYNRVSSPVAPARGNMLGSTPEIKKMMVSNLSTVAVVPITKDVPLSHFTMELYAAIKAITPTLRLTRELIQEELGSTALESIHEFRLRTWLGHQEDNHRIVLYQADADVSQWTARCIRQADCILLVGLAETTPSHIMDHIVKQVESISMRVQKELVLLHRETVAHPSGTVQWLNALGWLSSYFHVRCPDMFFTSPVCETAASDLPPPPSKHSDFSRLARRLTGSSVGLVLGGGGARGIAHVGAIKAFAEAGVPIDMIAGTSIGAFVGALYCEDRDAEKVERRAREWSKGMAAYSDKIFDLTYPTTSMFTGRAFNKLIHKVFAEKQIEDLWIPYLCISTDITESKIRVHSSGSLWRYVRASMSLSGYMPPLCDPVDGHLLLDGGYVNNLPADVMRSHGAETIIAIDVGAEDNNDLTNYGDHISGWYLLWNRINPFAKKIRVPTLTEIQSRLAYVSCIRQLEEVKCGMCEYVRPPIDSIATMQFASFETILPIGYLHCKTVISGWMKNHEMSHLLTAPTEEDREVKRRQTMVDKFEGLSKQNSSSVRNLVALAAQINRHDYLHGEDIDGDRMASGYWSNPEDQVYSDQILDDESPGSDSTHSPSRTSQQMFTLSDSELA